MAIGFQLELLNAAGDLSGLCIDRRLPLMSLTPVSELGAAFKTALAAQAFAEEIMLEHYEITEHEWA